MCEGKRNRSSAHSVVTDQNLVSSGLDQRNVLANEAGGLWEGILGQLGIDPHDLVSLFLVTAKNNLYMTLVYTLKQIKDSY